MHRDEPTLRLLIVATAMTIGGAPAAAQEASGAALATFAGGCFWCMEAPFEKLDGVDEVISGYAGGDERNPTYEQMASGRTGHTETVQVRFDPKVISYETLLEVYWRQIDPTDADGQFVDRGRQYRPEIFVHDGAQRAAAEKSKRELASSGRFEAAIVVPITPFETFYEAEEYHQDYYKKSPIRYKTYRWGSGRDRFLRRFWKDDEFKPGQLPSKSSSETHLRWQRPPTDEIKGRRQAGYATASTQRLFGSFRCTSWSSRDTASTGTCSSSSEGRGLAVGPVRPLHSMETLCLRYLGSGG